MRLKNFINHPGLTYKRRLFIIIGSLLFISLGCKSHKSRKIPAYIQDLRNLTVYPASIDNKQSPKDIKLIPEMRLGTTNKTYFGAIGDIVVDERGRIFIGDYQRQGIHVFQKNGEHISFIGGEGSGPGEFRAISSMRIVANKLCIYDSRMMRMTEIDLDSLGHLETKKIRPPSRKNIEKISGTSHTGIGKILTMQDGQLLVEFYPLVMVSPSLPGYNLEDKRLSQYYLMNFEGEILSERLFQLRNQVLIPANVGNARRFNVGYRYEFLGKPLMAVSDDGRIYTAWTEDFMIRTYGPNGKYQHAFYYPYERKRLERKEAIQNVQDFGGGDYSLGWVHNVELPDAWPALSYMVADDRNRLWISTVAGDYEQTDWWVLDEHGRLQATFTWPRNRIIQEIKNGYVYAIETDNETGAKQVVGFKIEMNLP